MVNVEILHAATVLATPTITFENLNPELLVRYRREPVSRILGKGSSHATAVSSVTSSFRSTSGRNFMSCRAEASREEGSVGETCPGQKIGTNHLQAVAARLI